MTTGISTCRAAPAGRLWAAPAAGRLWALLLSLLLCAAGLALLTGCAGPAKRADVAASVAGTAGWIREDFRTEAFLLRGWSRGIGTRAETLVVYIEGDGSAWQTRTRLSADPTPRDPVALKLAVKDPAPAVLYLARPCHYTRAADPACKPAYWSSHRYAPEVIASVSAAIDQARARAGAGTVALVGHSGGGAVAALVAARRSDVTRLVTVAANLDHAAWTRHHDVSPLSGSANPADVAAAIQHVPQVHYVGGKDTTVPRAIVEAYVRRMTDPSRTRIVEVPEFDHRCCWERNWPLSQ